MRQVAVIAISVFLVALVGGCAWLYAPDKPRAALEAEYAARPSAFVDLEPFKGHTYPDVLISVLIEFFRSLKLWLDEAAVAPANRTKVWRRWFSKPRKRPLARGTAGEISAEIDGVLEQLSNVVDRGLTEIRRRPSRPSSWSRRR